MQIQSNEVHPCNEISNLAEAIATIEPVAPIAPIKDKSFFVGGRAVFTVSGPDARYTFRIGRSKPEQPFFVSLLAGPDNENDFVYIGLYNPERDEVRLTAKSRMADDSRPVKAVRWAVRQTGKELPKGYAIMHEGKCCRCGRALTVPESIEAGIGPECAKKG